MKKKYRTVGDVKALKFLMRNQDSFTRMLTERDGPNSSELKELQILIGEYTGDIPYWRKHSLKRHIFMVSLESIREIPETTVEEYIKTALKRFSNLYQDKVDYFGGTVPPVFQVKKLFSIDGAEQEVETLREVARELAYIKDFLKPFFIRVDPITVKDDEDYLDL